MARFVGALMAALAGLVRLPGRAGRGPEADEGFRMEEGLRMEERPEMKEGPKMDEALKLGAPWATYAARVGKLFERDGAVSAEYDDGACKLTLRVEGRGKAEAIGRLLPAEVAFGNVKLEVEVVPSDGEPSEAEAFRVAFAGNPALVDVVEGQGPAGDIAFALFAPEAVQLFEDDISEYGGLTTLTCKDLAESVLKRGDVLVSSAPKE